MVYLSAEDVVLSSLYGKTIIFITHKLREVLELSDRITVLRRGKNAGELITRETSQAEIARMMVGREVLLRVNKTPAHPDGAVFCLVEAPSKEAAEAVHREAHGFVADEIFEVMQGS